MAEILSPRGGGRTTPRIDLTPMVDLGFLLITFFIMTTTMAKPRTMDIQMPYTPAPPGGTVFLESSAITLMPAGDHRIFYYEGIYQPGMPLKEATGTNALRKVLIQKQQVLLHRAVPRERELQVLVKAHATATMQDLVSLLDEMEILKVKYFALVDIAPEEAGNIAARLRQP